MATYTKLKSGEWGIRVEGSAREGQTVTVRKKDGTTKQEKIVKVVWSGNGISLCAIHQSYTPKAGRRGRLSDDDRCEVCDGNKWTCGHCVGW